MTASLDVAWLGRRDYDETSRLQEELVERRRRDETGDLLLMLEHPPTYTCGRRTRPGDLPRSRDWYRDHGFAVSDTPRGGQVTYHGPGQLVIYPIIDLRGIGNQPQGGEKVDVAGFVATLEKSMIEAAATYLAPKSPTGSVKGSSRALNRPSCSRDGFLGTIHGLTGVWFGAGVEAPDEPTATSMAADVASGRVAKIGSIGLRISRGISSHGLALNVSCDLEPFDSITACGIESCRVTSIAESGGGEHPVREVGEVVAGELAGLLDRRIKPVEPEQIGIEPAGIATA